MTAPPATTDAQIGRTVQQLREHLGITQSRLAEDMVAHGHAWHQQTVVKTEKGLRPLRLTEACDLATVLHVELDRLTGAGQMRPELLAVRGHLLRCEEADRTAEVARAAAAAARSSLRAAVKGTPEIPGDLKSRVDAVLTDP